MVKKRQTDKKRITDEDQNNGHKTKQTDQKSQNTGQNTRPSDQTE